MVTMIGNIKTGQKIAHNQSNIVTPNANYFANLENFVIYKVSFHALLALLLSFNLSIF